MLSIHSLIFIAIAVVGKKVDARQESFEAKLREELFKTRKTDHLQLPRESDTDSVIVSQSISLQYIHEVDPHKNLFSAIVWLKLDWEDRHLAWDPQSYEGIKSITVNPYKIWTPNITVVNNIDQMDKNIAATGVLLKHGGSCTYVPQILAKTYCVMDVQNFPYDEQTCSIVLGSWTYVGNELDIRFAANKLDISTTTEASEWMYVASTQKKTVHKMICCPELYHNVEYEVTVRRRSGYYQVTIMMPTVMSALLGLVVFWLPPTSPQKLYFGGFNLLALILLLFHLSMIVPFNGGNIPNIVHFCGAMVAVNALCLVLSLATLRLARHQPAPGWLKTFLTPKTRALFCLQQEDSPTSSAEGSPTKKNSDNDMTLAAMLLNRMLFVVHCAICIILPLSIFR